MQGTTYAPLAQSYSELSSSQFREQVNARWEAASELKDTVIEKVERDQLDPMTGAAIIACIAGQVTGYQEFHRELRASDLVSVLQPGQRR